MTKQEQENEQLAEAWCPILLGEKLPCDIFSTQTGELIIPANRKITKTLIRKFAEIGRVGLVLR